MAGFATYGGIPLISKDPDAVLDYAIDWSRWLGEDALTAAQWAVPDGLTKVSEALDTGTATIWLSGGSVGVTYLLTCHITTAAGREEDQSFRIKIKER